MADNSPFKLTYATMFNPPEELLEEAIKLANNVPYGLTAGFYSDIQKESEWFSDRIEAGVIYSNRPQGATTGAWPGFQPFGG